MIPITGHRQTDKQRDGTDFMSLTTDAGGNYDFQILVTYLKEVIYFSFHRTGINLKLPDILKSK